MRVTGILLLAITCSGCLATGPGSWSHAPDETTTLMHNIYECRADADAESHRATAFGGVVMPIVGLFARNSTYSRCMEARGYRRLP